jgi:flagellar assembly protein FliH|tara:strand:- start:58 stop:816 length:759 start_codon:yes stop_codon:yes gene_type:complete
VSRIPADKTANFSSWQIPEVTEGQIVKVENLKNRGPKGELVNVDKNQVIYNSLTAGQLEEISNQAYEDVREQARADGLKQGKDEGYQAGISAAREDLEKNAKNLSKTIDMLFSSLAGQDDDVEQALVNLVIGVSRSVLRRELTLDSSQIVAIVNEAVAELPLRATDITIYLNEQDFQLLQKHSEILAHWQLQIDRALTPGGCRVTSRQSVVTYSLEDQFQQTINSLVDKRFSEPSNPIREQETPVIAEADDQ